jgi:hypothetical protein
MLDRLSYACSLDSHCRFSLDTCGRSVVFAKRPITYTCISDSHVVTGKFVENIVAFIPHTPLSIDSRRQIFHMNKHIIESSFSIVIMKQI